MCEVQHENCPHDESITFFFDRPSGTLLGLCATLALSRFVRGSLRQAPC